MAFLPDTNLWIFLLKTPGGILGAKLQSHRFVEQQNLRFRGETTGMRQKLLLTVGKLTGEFIPLVSESDKAQQPHGLLVISLLLHRHTEVTFVETLEGMERAGTEAVAARLVTVGFCAGRVMAFVGSAIDVASATSGLVTVEDEAGFFASARAASLLGSDGVGAGGAGRAATATAFAGGELVATASAFVTNGWAGEGSEPRVTPRQ